MRALTRSKLNPTAVIPFVSVPKPKRSEAIKVYLTPDEFRQVNDQAERLNRTTSKYARHLLLSPLSADLIQGRTQEQQCQALEQQLGELYGLFNLLSSDLAEQLNELATQPTKELDHAEILPPENAPSTSLQTHLSLPELAVLIQQLQVGLETTREEMQQVRKLLTQMR